MKCVCVLGGKKLQKDCTMAPQVAVQFSRISVHLAVSNLHQATKDDEVSMKDLYLKVAT